ncbi:MAG TPA: AAA family ATPase [Pirellulales bacterium]|nr:AAA family ATPase [Pirellulales bacterium]
MKIVAAEIDGFGVWSGLKLGNMADGVTVFYGPNEAGKTTLLQFVRTMLCGFSPERWHRYLPPVHGGRAGGSLVVSGRGGRFTICRHASATSPIEGELRVLGPDGTIQPDYVVQGLMGHIDEPTFNQVFAVGLREMQELGTLSDSAAAEFLYHLSTGLDGVALADVLRELATARGRTVPPDQNTGHLDELFEKRAKIAGEIDELRAQVHRHAAIAHELEELATELQQSESEQAELERTERAIRTALAVREPWRRRRELVRELAQLPPLAALPAGAIERLDLVNESLQGRRRRIAEIVRSRRALRNEAAALDFNARLARHAPRIEALAEQEAWLTTLESQVEHLTAAIGTLEQELAEDRRVLGMGGKTSSHKQPSTNKPLSTGALIARLRPAARALTAPQGRLQTAQQEQAAATQRADALAAKIKQALGGDKQELSPALEEAGNRVTQLRRRVQIDERLSQLSGHEAELAEQTRTLLERQLMPAWVLVALGAVFVLGVVLVLANMFLPLSLVGSAGWLLAAIGALGAAGAAGGKFLLDRSAANQLEASQKQAAILGSQVKQAKEEREALDRELPRGGGPLLTRLQTAEKELAALEELLGVDAERQAALASAEAAGRRAAAADNERREARRRWEQALAAAGLPKQLTPKQARQFATRHRQLADLELERDRRYDELQERQREFDMLAGRIKQLLADVGLHPTSQRPTDQLRELRGQLAAHQVVAAQRDALHERAGRLKRQQARLTTAVRRGEQRRQQILHEAAAANEAELRQRAAEYARRQALAERREALARDIAAALAGRLTEDELHGWLDGETVVDLDERLETLAGQTQAAANRSRALHEARGRLDQEAAALVADRRMASRLADLAAVDQQAREAIEHWRVLTVAESTLDAVRRTYETERQPEALQEASAYLERLTGGRYVRVWAPFGERALRVEDSEGKSLAVEVLSRGTREQLFLSLRLALVGVFARQGIDLPLVLDDVLVNFDARRTLAAVDVLREFAQTGHQVLVFTCHEHLWNVFRQLKVTAYPLPAHDDPEPATVAYPQPVEEAPHELPDEEPDVAATWRPEPAGDGMIEIAADNSDEEEEEIPQPKPKRRRKAAARKKPKVEEPPREAENETQPEERPHRVSVLRRNQLQHPFADTSWHEPVDDEDDQIIVTDESSDDDEPPFEVSEEPDEPSAWPDETLFQQSDDWDSLDDDGTEAA